MPGDDVLTEAIDELYSADPDDFVKRRGALASQARQDGDPKTATAITALRRPTKAAWIINRLVRAEPDVASGLAELAKRLRDAQRTLDGAQLRELTQQRRKLIDRSIRQAFNLSGQSESAAALRQEVASTLEAALADPDVAEQLGTGTLVRSAEWSGFGDSTPTLAAVPPLRAEPKGSAKRRAASKSSGKAPATAQRTEPTEPSGAKLQQERVAQAEQALAAASDELDDAVAAEGEHDDKVAQLAEQLADARRRLDEARLSTRQAKAKQREAQRRLDRVRK
jgi:hypothetical protein